MSADKIGNTSEQLGQVEAASAMIIDGKIVTRDDYRALQAQIEVLQSAIDRYFALDDSKLLRDAMAATPAACLAEVRAGTAKEYYQMGWEHSVSTKAEDGDHYACGRRLAQQFSDAIRQGGA